MTRAGSARWRATAVGCALALVVATIASASASASADAARARAVPGQRWQVVKPATVGMDATRLAELATLAEDGQSNCLLVVRHGKIAGEWYFRGTDEHSTQDVFSMTKSITSTLVGIAQDDGELRITDPAADWIPEWRGGPSSSVTVQDILSNDSGREWSLATDYVQLVRAPDKTKFAVGLSQQHPPGAVWAYNNSVIQTLSAVLHGATQSDVVAYARRRLFAPLGMTDTTMTTDGAGNAQTFSGVQSTCRDMARFGLLLLHEGAWGARRIVSSSWVAAATGMSSTPLNAAYGYLWWLNREGVIASPLVATSAQDASTSMTTGQLVPGAPAAMFWALGLGDQLVQVDRASDTVVVRLGTSQRPTGTTFGPAQASRVVTEAITGS